MTDDYLQSDREALSSFVRAMLRGFPLTRAEASALCDANYGATLPQDAWHGLATAILDMPAWELSRKWKIDANSLAQRVLANDQGTRFALAVAVADFWRLCQGQAWHGMAWRGRALLQAGFCLSD